MLFRSFLGRGPGGQGGAGTPRAGTRTSRRPRAARRELGPHEAVREREQRADAPAEDRLRSADAAIISGIVTNGPIPHIWVMLIATAERSPIVRSKPSSRTATPRSCPAARPDNPRVVRCALPVATEPYFDLGSYTRGTSTASASAQVWFDRGLVWSYAFHHEEAIRCFERAVEHDAGFALERSEERRVGKECSLLCRSRWSPYH